LRRSSTSRAPDALLPRDERSPAGANTASLICASGVGRGASRRRRHSPMGDLERLSDDESARVRIDTTECAHDGAFARLRAGRRVFPADRARRRFSRKRHSASPVSGAMAIRPKIREDAAVTRPGSLLSRNPPKSDEFKRSARSLPA
jgi:hypothetical protein